MRYGLAPSETIGVTRVMHEGGMSGNGRENKMREIEVATFDAYLVAWEADVGQILPCEREGGNIIDPYAVAIVESKDTPIDNDAPVMNETFCA